MAEISRDPLGYKTKKITLLIASLLGITLIGAIVWGGMIFNNYRESGGVPKMASAPAQVAITNPPTGARAESGETVTVDVSAIGPAAYNSIELWLNGELAGVQAAPAGGMQPFSTQFSWTISEPGYHSLIAIGVDVNGQKVLSTQVVVLAVQSDFEDLNLTESLGNVPSVEPAPPTGGYSPPVGPVDGEGINPAGNWAGTLGDIATSLLAEVKPAAPELVAKPGECVANLFIHDLSINEEGFIVYRQMINTPDWQKIATLSSQSQVEWLEYVDEGISGAVTYYVSAFNSQGEAQSNPVLVNIDPAGCANESADQEIEKVDVALTLTDGSADQVYCYKSRDGVNWSRWPAIGFFSPDEEGNLPESPIMVQRTSSPGLERGLASQGVMMECWGWQGGGLSRLGEFAVGELMPDFTGKQIVLGTGLTAKLVVKTEQQAGTGGVYPVGDFGLPSLPKHVDPSLITLPPLIPLSPNLPKANLSVTLDKEVCGQHLPPEAQNLLGKTLLCFPYPAYDPDKGAKMFQPYLVWGFDFEPICVGGVGENCKSYWELLSMAEQTGGQVGFTILAMTGGIKTVWNVMEPNLTMFVVPPLGFLGDTKYSVRLWYRLGNQGVGVSASPDDNISPIGEFEISPGEIQYGPYSNWVTISGSSLDLPNAIALVKSEQYRYLDITFDNLDTIGLLDGSGENAPTLELYGYFRVKAPSMGHWETEICYNEWIQNCNYEPYWAGSYRYLNIADWEMDQYASDVYGGLTLWHSQIHWLEERLLCQSDSKYNCSINGERTFYEYDNNTIRVAVKDGDVLKFQMKLIDHDNLSANDEMCVASFTKLPIVFYNLKPHIYNDWSPFLVDDYTLCRVNAIVSLVEVQP